jgi:hypothetical protein
VVMPVVVLMPVMVVATVIASVAAPVATAAAVLVPAPVLPGTRPGQALERLQSFKDLAPIVVLHGRPPLLRPYTGQNELCNHFRRHRWKSNCDRQRAALCAT